MELIRRPGPPRQRPVKPQYNQGPRGAPTASWALRNRILVVMAGKGELTMLEVYGLLGGVHGLQGPLADAIATLVASRLLEFRRVRTTPTGPLVARYKLTCE